MGTKVVFNIMNHENTQTQTAPINVTNKDGTVFDIRRMAKSRNVTATTAISA
jgi:hypothetical protein